MVFGPSSDMDDYDEDDFQDEYEADDGDLKRCQNCDKKWPREDLCYVDAPFGEVVCVCPRCARGIGLGGYSSDE
jgi:hypothetical protein